MFLRLDVMAAYMSECLPVLCG